MSSAPGRPSNPGQGQQGSPPPRALTDTIATIAKQCGHHTLTTGPPAGHDVAASMAPDLEYRIREVVQEASKFMRHSKRTTLTTQDINNALRMMGSEQLFGFSSKEPLRFQKASEKTGLYVVDDPVLSLDDVINQKLPTPPVEPSLSAYWMAIEGVQPAGLAGAAAAQHPGDNAAGPPVSATAAAPTGGPAAVPAAAATSESIVKNMLSKELQLYYDSVTEAVMSGTAAQREAAIASLGMDSGLQELVPYFSLFVSEKVTANLRNLEVLLALMRTVFSLLTNPEIYLDPYVHQLMPAILTCVVGKRLCADPVENHWKLRDYAAELVALACRKFGAAYATLQPRITKTLLSAFVNPSRPLTTHYGAVVALTALGPHTIHTLLLPNLRSYMNKLEPELSSAAQNNPRKRAEAAKCHGALMMAAGAYLSKYWMVFSPPPPAAPEPTPTPQVAAAASSGATAAAAPMDVEEPKAAAATEEASVRLEHAPPVPKKRGLMDNYKLPRKKAKPAPVAAATASAAADAPVKLELAPPAGAGAGAAGGALLPQHAVAYEELFEIFGDQLAPFLPVNSGLPLLQLS